MRDTVTRRVDDKQPGVYHLGMAMETIFHFRMDRDLEELLEAEVERLRENNPGMTIHKSDVVRSILYAELRHLATHEPIEGEAA